MLQRERTCSVIIAWTALLTACSPTGVHDGAMESPRSATSQLAAIPLPPVAPPRPPPSLRSFMTEHYFVTAWARTEVIVGDLAGLREPLELLAQYQVDAPELERWRPWLSRLQASARQTARAQTLELAAAGIATMGGICGECHAALGQGPPVLPSGRLESRTDTMKDRMRLHSQAVERLWEGLTAPSDRAWQSGAEALATLPIGERDPELRPASVRAFAELKSLGVSALEATRPEQRADVYGVLLATCAHCHIKARVRSADAP